MNITNGCPSWLRTENGRHYKRWAPSIRLSFLIGQFQGALQSCQVERAQNDKSLVGCGKVNELKKAMQELCRNQS